MPGRRTGSARVAIWLGLRPTPLRRTTDRIEVLVRWLAVAVVLASMILAPLAADAASASLPRSTVARYSASGDAVQATMLATDHAGVPMPGQSPRARQAAPSEGAGPEIAIGMLTVLLGAGVACGLLTLTSWLLRRPRQRYWEHAWSTFNHDQVHPR